MKSGGKKFAINCISLYCIIFFCVTTRIAAQEYAGIDFEFELSEDYTAISILTEHFFYDHFNEEYQRLYLETEELFLKREIDFMAPFFIYFDRSYEEYVVIPLFPTNLKLPLTSEFGAPQLSLDTILVDSLRVYFNGQMPVIKTPAKTQSALINIYQESEQNKKAFIELAQKLSNFLMIQEMYLSFLLIEDDLEYVLRFKYEGDSNYYFIPWRILRLFVDEEIKIIFDQYFLDPFNIPPIGQPKVKLADNENNIKTLTYMFEYYQFLESGGYFGGDINE